MYIGLFIKESSCEFRVHINAHKAHKAQYDSHKFFKVKSFVHATNIHKKLCNNFRYSDINTFHADPKIIIDTILTEL